MPLFLVFISFLIRCEHTEQSELNDFLQRWFATIYTEISTHFWWTLDRFLNFNFSYYNAHFVQIDRAIFAPHSRESTAYSSLTFAYGTRACKATAAPAIQQHNKISFGRTWTALKLWWNDLDRHTCNWWPRITYHAAHTQPAERKTTTNRKRQLTPTKTHAIQINRCDAIVTRISRVRHSILMRMELRDH